MSTPVSKRRTITKLKKSITHLEGKVIEVERFKSYDKSAIDDEITNWNTIVTDIYEELQQFMQPEQKIELEKYILSYCNSNKLTDIIANLEIQPEEEEE